MTTVSGVSLKARGSIPVDTNYLDEQIEEKRLRDVQLAQQEKQQGGWARFFIHSLLYATTHASHHYLS
jgi:hypothetical protein